MAPSPRAFRAERYCATFVLARTAGMIGSKDSYIGSPQQERPDSNCRNKYYRALEIKPWDRNEAGQPASLFTGFYFFFAVSLERLLLTDVRLCSVITRLSIQLAKPARVTSSVRWLLIRLSQGVSSFRAPSDKKIFQISTEARTLDRLVARWGLWRGINETEGVIIYTTAHAPTRGQLHSVWA